jgi:hypothetical protein
VHADWRANLFHLSPEANFGIIFDSEVDEACAERIGGLVVVGLRVWYLVVYPALLVRINYGQQCGLA